MIRPEDLEARLLYRDASMLVLDKPPGIAVHAGPKGGANLEAMFGALQFGLPRPPALAHRLDRETSGCLVLGRHRQALADLGKLFADGRITKTYLAVVQGNLPEKDGRIELPLTKQSATRGWWMKVDRHNGQSAITEYSVLAEKDGFSLLELHPRTGRTHQLRVHLSALGAPIVGDRIYGSAVPPPAGPMLHLHARRIVVPLRKNAAATCITAPLPPHIFKTIEALGWRLNDET
jgi:tRNA pseudouridine32 synthase / 23S rRNA pseudouridine746 synthase